MGVPCGSIAGGLLSSRFPADAASHVLNLLPPAQPPCRAARKFGKVVSQILAASVSARWGGLSQFLRRFGMRTSFKPAMAFPEPLLASVVDSSSL